MKNARLTNSRTVSNKSESESLTIIKKKASQVPHLLATGTANIWANVANIWHPWDSITLDHEMLQVPSSLAL